MNSIKMLNDLLEYFKKAQNKALEEAKIKLEERKGAQKLKTLKSVILSAYLEQSKRQIATQLQKNSPF